MKKNSFLPFLFFPALIFFQCSAEKNAKGPAAGLGEDNPEETKIGKRWAICVGIDDYEDPAINDLQKAGNDAVGIGESLKLYGQFDNVYIMNDEFDPRGELYPTLRKVKGKLNFLEGFIEPEDLVVFSFSGHGFSDDQGKGYLIVCDSDPNDLFETSLPIEFIVNWLRSLGVRKSLLLLDACRGAVQKNKSGELSALKQDKFESAEVSAVFFATKDGWYSYEDSESDYGVFSRFVIQGLQGGADDKTYSGNGDGIVTFGELAGFVEESVTGWALKQSIKQRPYTRVYGEKSGDIALALYRESGAAGTLSSTVTQEKAGATIAELSSSGYPSESYDKNVYHPIKAFDGDPHSAWVENLDGYGRGSYLEVEFLEGFMADEVRILGGYFDQRWWAQNNRLKKAVIALNGKQYTLDFEDGMKSHNYVIQGGLEIKSFMITIMDAYLASGFDWNDSAISEIEFYYQGKKIGLNTDRYREFLMAVPRDRLAPSQ